MYRTWWTTLLFALSVAGTALAAGRTSPPSGAKVVRQGTTTSGEYATLSAAVAALPDDGTAQSIFIYAGNYTEQVYIDRDDVTIYGYTTDVQKYTHNVVTISHMQDAARAGSDDASGTLRIHSNNVKLYNINIENTRGPGSQAIALSAYSDQFGAYAVGLYGYQDTLLAQSGNQVYLKGYIEGATDFIFGQHAVSYFQGNTIAVTAGGCITANGRGSSDDPSIYVFNNNVVKNSSTASSTPGNYFFGRAWGVYSRVIFLNTDLEVTPNAAIWKAWSDTQDTTNIFYGDYNTTGSDVPSKVSEPSWTQKLTSSAESTYSITSVLGSSYTSWVDTAYLS
ncbi:hypothetical protein PUNSTDRAFT_154815 [Punctularia strigosozonata HHB-11173 SS5]|uniref:uncharacterized protein n=1 Tax=Punctularia strigosozonata (strain HHB-11173) TaxID=741275 RepID=UPI00044179DA|nr:uncharacterized protein PUNSTDRAFT_154815 [Punctularia strigosozonata HHB-11173 SS5]EIN10120.1 hypothetical protein PUNSTDRAFT_154815 [Punctularia strigosozonata HHB-11173 SS5]